jgi:hypothetical protein
MWVAAGTLAAIVATTVLMVLHERRRMRLEYSRGERVIARLVGNGYPFPEPPAARCRRGVPRVHGLAAAVSSSRAGQVRVARSPARAVRQWHGTASPAPTRRCRPGAAARSATAAQEGGGTVSSHRR